MVLFIVVFVAINQTFFMAWEFIIKIFLWIERFFLIHNPDNKQSLGQRWIMVRVADNMSVFACWHWPNIGSSTVKFQQSARLAKWQRVNVICQRRANKTSNKMPTNDCYLGSVRWFVILRSCSWPLYYKQLHGVFR